VSRWVAHEHDGVHLARWWWRVIYDVLQSPGKYAKRATRHQVEQSHANMSNVTSQLVHPQESRPVPP